MYKFILTNIVIYSYSYYIQIQKFIDLSIKMYTCLCIHFLSFYNCKNNIELEEKNIVEKVKNILANN